eukprot:7388174-Prymnesium_polylepis.1
MPREPSATAGAGARAPHAQATRPLPPGAAPHAAPPAPSQRRPSLGSWVTGLLATAAPPPQVGACDAAHWDRPIWSASPSSSCIPSSPAPK